jgi:hypothetical protein
MMSLADLPGKVKFPGTWPLASVLAIAIGGTLIYSSTNSRLVTLESSVQDLRNDLADRETEAKQFATTLARLEEKTGAILDTVRRLENTSIAPARPR